MRQIWKPWNSQAVQIKSHWTSPAAISGKWLKLHNPKTCFFVHLSCVSKMDIYHTFEWISILINLAGRGSSSFSLFMRPIHRQHRSLFLLFKLYFFFFALSVWPITINTGLFFIFQNFFLFYIFLSTHSPSAQVSCFTFQTLHFLLYIFLSAHSPSAQVSF